VEITKTSIAIGRLKIGFGILAGDLKDGSFKEHQMQVLWLSEEFRPSEPIYSIVPEQWERLTQNAHKSGQNLTDGALCRLDNWLITPENKISLTFQPTSYKLFSTTNLMLDEPMTLQDKNRPPISIRELVGGDLSRASCYLANPLNVLAMLISADGFTFVPRRSSKVFERPNTWQASVGGAVAPEDKNPTTALIREIKEEWGLDVDREETEFIVLGINQKTGEPDLIGQVRTKKSCKQIMDVFSKHNRKFEFESIKSLELTEQNIRTCIEMLLQEDRWSQASDQAAFLAMLIRTFGLQTIEANYKSFS
jgi:8-oxo-dGTP pyrophosphatase MutT (NUDIX family)